LRIRTSLIILSDRLAIRREARGERELEGPEHRGLTFDLDQFLGSRSTESTRLSAVQTNVRPSPLEVFPLMSAV
jgi:hypothetical protein